MCLSRIKNFDITRPYGYQIFYKKNKKLVSMFHQDKSIKYNKWETDSADIKIEAFFPEKKNGSKIYETGFHIFLNEKDAKEVKKLYPKFKLEIKKVHFKNVITTGLENWIDKRSFPVIVAKERFIHKS